MLSVRNRYQRKEPYPLEDESTPTETTGDASAGTVNTEATPSETVENSIPYARFQQINEKLKAAEAALAAKEAADAEATRKAAEANAEFERLYRETQAELAKEKEDRERERIAALRKSIAAKHKLPESFAARLRGTTEEELDADATEIAAALPKPEAPAIDATTKDKTTQGVPDKAFRDMTYAEKEALFDADPELFRKLSAQG